MKESAATEKKKRKGNQDGPLYKAYHAFIKEAKDTLGVSHKVLELHLVCFPIANCCFGPGYRSCLGQHWLSAI